MLQNNDTIFSEVEFKETEITSLQGFLIWLLDFVIDILIFFLVYTIMPLDILVKIETLDSTFITIIVILVATVNRFLFLLLFDKTISMMVFRVKLLNKQLQPLSNKEKVLSLFRSRFSKMLYYKEK